MVAVIKGLTNRVDVSEMIHKVPLSQVGCDLQARKQSLVLEVLRPVNHTLTSDWTTHWQLLNTGSETVQPILTLTPYQVRDNTANTDTYSLPGQRQYSKHWHLLPTRSETVQHTLTLATRSETAQHTLTLTPYRVRNSSAYTDTPYQVRKSTAYTQSYSLAGQKQYSIYWHLLHTRSETIQHTRTVTPYQVRNSTAHTDSYSLPGQKQHNIHRQLFIPGRKQYSTPPHPQPDQKQYSTQLTWNTALQAWSTPCV